MGYSPAQGDRLSCQKTSLRVGEIAVGRSYAATGKYGRLRHDRLGGIADQGESENFPAASGISKRWASITPW
jgi:hypothetical protein